MLMEVGEFCERVRKDADGLVRDLQDLTGRYGEREEDAWYSSLTQLVHVLDRPQLADFRAYHLSLGQRGNLSVEYRLPASAAWCDVVLLGRGVERPAAVILELKDWNTAGDRPGSTEGLVEHNGEDRLHPAAQVGDYVEYCQRFHSAVLAEKASVAGCVFFTKAVPTTAYVSAPHEALTATYPVFADTRRHADEQFPAYLGRHLHRPDANFAGLFDQGLYKQDRNFCEQIARQIENPSARPFVLLDGQRLGFELCRARIRQALAEQGDKRRKLVVIIEGPPGSGKSVVAARLWADLVQDPAIRGNLVVTTTSSSQSSNWERLFAEAANSGAASGLVKRANTYAPETTNWVGKQRKKLGLKSMNPEQWRRNLALCRKEVRRLRCPDETYTVSIVDEAHALINPEDPKARPGVSGWPTALGPQAYHVMRASRVSVFLLDAEQGFRDRETTSAKQIGEWARELHADLSPPISLADTQFRLAGSAEYMDWLDVLLQRRNASPPKARWRWSASNPKGLRFEIVEDPQALETQLRRHGAKVRLVAAYGRKWKTKHVRHPHSLPREEMDFDIRYQSNGKAGRWSKVWNYAPNQDYTLFVQAPARSAMAADPLCEVGCPYVVRGFDWDYVGVLWLRDLVWRSGAWKPDVEHVHESGISMTRAAAKRDKSGQGPGTAELLARLQQAYRILFSRAIRGVYVWFEDEETRRHVESLLPV